MKAMHYHLLKIKYFGVIVLVALTGLVLASGEYPDVNNSGGPTDQFPAIFSAFNPPVDSSVEVASSTPQIAEWTRQNQPGDTMVLTGEDLSSYGGSAAEGRDTRFMIYGEGISVDGEILRLDGQQAAVKLSERLPANELYLMWPHNENGFGEPVKINQAEAWWVGFDTVSAGEIFYVYGRNLKLGSGSSYLYIKELGRWLTSSDGNPYKVTFQMPLDVPIGSYTVYAHNGHGRKYGWSEPLTMTVKSTYSWNGNVYNVEDYGANGGDAVADTAGIFAANNAAKGDPGSTVYFPAGTYYLTETLQLNGNTKYVGAGMDDTSLTYHSSTLGNPLLIGPNWSGGKKNIQIRDLTVALNEYGVIGGSSSLQLGYMTDVVLEKVRLTNIDTPFGLSYHKQGLTEFHNGIRYKMLGCEFNGSGGIYIGAMSDARFESCTFIGREDINQMTAIIGAERLDFSKCIVRNHDTSDASSGFGWAKGRWITMTSTATDMYVGDNVTIDLGPRQATPFLDALVPTGISAWDDGKKTLSFADIPDEYHGRGEAYPVYDRPEVTIRYASGSPGYPEKSWRLIEIDAINDTITLEIPEYAKDWFDESSDLICTSQDHVDGNSGEQILFEGAVSRLSASPVAASAKSVIFSDLDAIKHVIDWKLPMVSIVDGCGIGQARRIESVDSASGTVNIDRPWTVVPDTGSVINFGGFADRVLIYGNTFDGRLDGTVTNHSATTALNVYGNGSDVILDSNTFSELRSGIYYSAEGYLGYYPALSARSANMFSYIGGNSFKSCWNDIYMRERVNTAFPNNNQGARFLGNVVRNNNSDGSLNALAYLGVESTYSKLPTRMNVFQDNSFRNFANTIEEQAGVENQVWIGNTFFGDGSGVGYSVSAGHDPVLRDNVWSNFEQVHGGNLPGSILELPIRCVQLNSENMSRTLPVFNSGTDELKVTVVKKTDSPWLDVGLKETEVLPESSEEIMELTIISEPSDGSTAIVEIADGLVSRQMTVIFSADSLSTMSRITFPWGHPGLISVKLVDQVSGQIWQLGQFDSPSEIVVDRDLSGSWYKLEIERYDEASNTWVTEDEKSIGRGGKSAE